MASSSDWIAALQNPNPAGEGDAPLDLDGVATDWIDALTRQAGFVDGLPMAQQANDPQEHEKLEAAVAGPAADCIELTHSQPEPETDPIEEAFAQGKAAGIVAAKAQFVTEQEHRRALRVNLRLLDQAAIDSLANELSETVIMLCEQAIAGFEPDPEQLPERCRHAAKRLGAAAKDCALHLHPDDIPNLDDGTRDLWRVVSDDCIARGGLRFESADGSVSDGPTDWRRAIAAAVRG